MKKKIGDKHETRIIPITTKSLWKKLLKRLSKQEELWRKSKKLCKLWMGHVTERVFNKYIHIYEIMEREIRSGFGDDSFSWSSIDTG